MVTYILLLKRKPGMTKAQFREHYETSHVALAKKYLGHLFQDYRRHYPEESVGLMANGEWGSIGDEGYDAITKVDFDHIIEVQKIPAQAFGQRAPDGRFSRAHKPDKNHASHSGAGVARSEEHTSELQSQR